MIKRADGLLIAALLLIAAALFLLNSRGGDSARGAAVYFEDELLTRLSLQAASEWTWRDGDAFVTVAAEAGGVRVARSSCPDQACVRQGRITRPGQAIICLPNRISVQLTDASELDATLY